MGMHTKTAYNHSERLRHLALDCFIFARNHHQAHTTLRDELARRVYDDPAYCKLPRDMRGYLNGWIACEHRHMYDALEWRVFWRGKLVPIREVLPGTWHECDPDKGQYVYRDDPSKIY